MVQNLFTLDEVILGREDIFKIAKYAIENNIIDVVMDIEDDISLSDNCELRYVEFVEDEDAVSS